MNFGNFNFGFNRETLIAAAIVIILLVFLGNFASSGGCNEAMNCVGGGIP